MWQLIRPYFRSIYRIASGTIGFFYDIKRFINYSGWKSNIHDKEERNYLIMRIYHGLEKSLSYQNRDSNRGWERAFKILAILKIVNKKNSNEIGFHDKAAKQILEKFIALPDNQNSKFSSKIKKELKHIDFNSNEQHGAKTHDFKDFTKGILENPENFFHSRSSLREFKEEIIPPNVIERAIKLAIKTPSVCNRQAWAVYHTSKKEIKNLILNYQNGNKPFGPRIPNVMVIATDLKAFSGGDEHYQHWIDGGLFSMSLIYAFHSLGIATCPLNWSQIPKNDMRLRKKVNIKPNHTIIMFLAIGYPNNKNKVCFSARRPIDEIILELEKVNK